MHVRRSASSETNRSRISQNSQATSPVAVLRSSQNDTEPIHDAFVNRYTSMLLRLAALRSLVPLLLSL